ncbi:MAG: flagellar hook-associated protein, partial [Candidatus Accumulibacter sp.]|nr:flagellar hook-associated protein [Accumulibacter sp.]
MAVSSPGLGSNLDVNSIVSQLMAVEKRPLTVLAQKQAGFQAKISALGSLQGTISAMQTAAGNL